VFAAKAKENQKEYYGNQYAPCQNSDKVQTVDTKKELAAIAGVSHDIPPYEKLPEYEGSGANDN
jgi:hypothetical protein